MIHFYYYKEKLSNGQWITADCWVPVTSLLGTRLTADQRAQAVRMVGKREVPVHERWYYFSAAPETYNAFVEGVAPGAEDQSPLMLPARGIPSDACPEVAEKARLLLAQGAHHHSYLHLGELQAILTVLPDRHPARFLMKMIVQKLQTIGGDDQRIVFFFLSSPPQTPSIPDLLPR